MANQLNRPKLYMVSELPTFLPEPKWTPEEDEELLKLDEEYCGRWRDITHLLSHTPYECFVRCEQLREQMWEQQQQDKEPSPIRDKKRPRRTLSDLEIQISKLENDLKTVKEETRVEIEDLKKKVKLLESQVMK